jgi:anti-sigma factor RsiW
MGMKHPETEIVPYLRDELPPRDRERVARHLEACPDCRETADAVHEILDHLARAVPAPPEIAWGRFGAELRARLVEAERAPGAWARTIQWWWRPIPVAGTAALAGVLLLLAVLSPFRQDSLNGSLTAFEEEFVGDRLDLLEDLEVIRDLDALGGAGEG